MILRKLLILKYYIEKIMDSPLIHYPTPISAIPSDDGPQRVGDANFTPYVINVPKGEDITKKIISFCEQESGAVLVLSATGLVSYVTLDYPKFPGGVEIFGGRYEILSLTGSFMPSDNGVLSNKAGGMSISLTSPDGHFVDGRVVGLLIAATPVQVVLGTSLPGHHEENNAEDLVESANPPINLKKLPSEGKFDDDSVDDFNNMEFSG